MHGKKNKLLNALLEIYFHLPLFHAPSLKQDGLTSGQNVFPRIQDTPFTSIRIPGLFFSQHEIPGEIPIVPGPLCDNLIIQREGHKNFCKISSFLPGWLQYRIKREGGFFFFPFKIRGMEKN